MADDAGDEIFLSGSDILRNCPGIDRGDLTAMARGGRVRFTHELGRRARFCLADVRREARTIVAGREAMAKARG